MSERPTKKRRHGTTGGATATTTNNNPLAAARQGRALQKQRNDERSKSSVSRKISTKAELQWHKRSGTGLQLFVEYYCGQPKGVVISAGDSSDDNYHAEHAIHEKRGDNNRQPSMGMSRAAQRRRKKKRKHNNDEEKDDGVNLNCSTTESMPSNSDKHGSFTPSRLYKDQLLSILTSKQQHQNCSEQIKTNISLYKKFFDTLSTPLPLTFRIRKSCSTKDADELRHALSNYASHVSPTIFDSDIYHAHQGLDKASLPHVCPALKELLNRHSCDGSMARQELGSMLPVWLLQKVGAFRKNGCRVLDMCASPGSKTLQALEVNLRAGSGSTVRANDINESRLQALQDAIQRSGVANQQLVKYSNFDASKLPIPKTEEKKYPIVLCDVPCSGDGTCRKDPHIIPTWLPSIGNKLHSVQAQILSRALQCVAVNGVVSYSTCSMNPVEDEAVVVAALEQMEQTRPALQFEIMKVSKDKLNGLILNPGITQWRVADYLPNASDANGSEGEEEDDDRQKLVWYDSYENAVAGAMDCACHSMWPPTIKAKGYNLPNCLRLFPQDQNTGGFFVALIQRVR